MGTSRPHVHRSLAAGAALAAIALPGMVAGEPPPARWGGALTLALPKGGSAVDVALRGRAGALVSGTDGAKDPIVYERSAGQDRWRGPTRLARARISSGPDPQPGQPWRGARSLRGGEPPVRRRAGARGTVGEAARAPVRRRARHRRPYPSVPGSDGRRHGGRPQLHPVAPRPLRPRARPPRRVADG